MKRKDMISKGRSMKGERQHTSKIFDMTVELMVSDILSGKYVGQTTKDIANQLNVTSSTIRGIFSGYYFQHITSKFSKQQLKLAGNMINGLNRFTDNEIRDIRCRIKNCQTLNSIAKLYNVNGCIISSIKTGKTYKNVV
jgi:uncharacterized protein YjcR